MVAFLFDLLRTRVVFASASAPGEHLEGIAAGRRVAELRAEVLVRAEHVAALAVVAMEEALARIAALRKPARPRTVLVEDAVLSWDVLLLCADTSAQKLESYISEQQT